MKIKLIVKSNNTNKKSLKILFTIQKKNGAPLKKEIYLFFYLTIQIRERTYKK